MNAFCETRRRCYRVNRLLKSENLDTVEPSDDLDPLVRSMLSKVVLNNHAQPTAEWEGHSLHVHACAFGIVLDAFHKSTLSDDEDRLLHSRHVYLVACVKSLLKILLVNLELLGNFRYLTPSCVQDMTLFSFRKIFRP